MPTVTQSRNIPGKASSGQHRVNGINQPTAVSTFPSGSQTTTSYRSKSRRDGESLDYAEASGEKLRSDLRKEYQTRYDNGHDFLTTRQEVTPLISGGHFYAKTGPTSNATYDGNVSIHHGAENIYATPSYPSSSSMKLDGTKCIAETKPTNQEAQLAATLAELRQRMPTIPGMQLHGRDNIPNKLGGEYLNIVFGILPTKKDLQMLAQAIKDFGKNSAQFQRSSDTTIRRRYVLRDTRSVVESASSCSVSLPFRTGVNATSTFFNTTGFSGRKVDLTTQKAWFAGAYTYHVSEAHSFLGKIKHWEQLADQLLGTEITLDTIYQLTPWSWLFDWFSNASEFISNVSAFSNDSLVLRYGYVMHETHTSRIRTAHPRPVTNAYGTSKIPTSISWNAEIIRKSRIRSTPYGFGLDTSAFSPKQWAILGALGLSRAPATALR